MPYQEYENGLYLVKQKSPEKGVDHYGILDIGNRLKHPEVDGRQPVVIHQVSPVLKMDWLQNTGNWEVLGRITDETMAIQRMNTAATTPSYDLIGNNCEHFARFVATGKKESQQLQVATLLVGLGVLVYFAVKRK